MPGYREQYYIVVNEDDSRPTLPHGRVQACCRPDHLDCKMLKIISAFITLFLCLTSTNGIQVPLRYGNPQPISRARPDSYLSHQVPINPIVDDVPVVDMDFDAPKVNLGALSGDYYTRLSHPLYPRHHLRIKKTKGFCDPSVEYVSYIPV